MPADPISIVTSILTLLIEIKRTLDKVGRNKKQCHEIGEHIDNLQTILNGLPPGAEKDEGVSEQLKRSEKTLDKWRDVVKAYDGKNPVLRAIKANGIAEVLGRFHADIFCQFSAMNLAFNSSMWGTINKLERQLEQFFSVLLPDRDSTQCATDQNKQESLTEKTDDIARSELVMNEKHNLPAADIKPPPHASLSDGSGSKSTPVEIVTEQGGHCIVNKIISRSNMTSVTSIDVHPAEPWIVTGHKGGNISIWDFQKQETVMELQVNEEPDKTVRWIYDIYKYIKDKPDPHWVCSVKFIPQEKWLSVGDGGGYIHVYAYTGTELSKVTSIRAHHGNSVNTLAVHPTEPCLLSSSAFGGTIKLWNWSKGRWMNIRTYDVKPVYPHGVLSLKFNPRDTNTFACVTKDNRVKVGDITTSGLTTKLMGPFEADYFFTGSQHLMATLSFKSPSSSEVENQIWDLETGKVVHTLAANGHQTSCIAGHPTLPILVTALDDGTICFWDTSTYRLLESVHVTDRPAHDLVLFTDTNGITRLIVSSGSMIAIMEVTLPGANTSGQTGDGKYGDIP